MNISVPFVLLLEAAWVNDEDPAPAAPLQAGLSSALPFPFFRDTACVQCQSRQSPAETYLH